MAHSSDENASFDRAAMARDERPPASGERSGLQLYATAVEDFSRGEPLANVLTGIVCRVEELAPPALGAILLVDGLQRLRHGVAPSLPRRYWEMLDGIP